MEHKVCALHALAASRVVFIKHIMCLKHPCNKSYGAYGTHILCLTHPFSKSHHVYETLFASHTLSVIVLCPWTKRVCLRHTFRKSRGFRAEDFWLVCSLFFLTIECEQKGHEMTPCDNFKVITFGCFTAMNVNPAVLWDVRPFTSIHRCRRFGVRMSPSTEFANLLLWKFVRSSYHCCCLFTRLHGNISFNNLVLSSV